MMKQRYREDGSPIPILTCPKCGKQGEPEGFVTPVRTPNEPEACYECHYGEDEDEEDGDGWVPGTPMLMKPMPAYVSPATGEVINDRDQRKSDLDKSGCVDANDLRPEGLAADKPRPFKNKRFVKKWNLEANAAEGVLDN